MRLITSFLLIICFCLTSPKKISAQTNQLNGTWITIKVEIDGSQLPAATYEKQKLIISDTSYTFIAESVDKGAVIYKEGKMDIYGRDGVNNGKHFMAIYKFENNQLVICYNLSGDKYPETFETKGKPTYFLAAFKKE